MTITCVAIALVAGVMPGPSLEKHETTTVHIRIDQDGGLPPAQLSEALNQMQRRAADIWRRDGLSSTPGHRGAQYRNGARMGEPDRSDTSCAAKDSIRRRA